MKRGERAGCGNVAGSLAHGITRMLGIGNTFTTAATKEHSKHAPNRQ